MDEDSGMGEHGEGGSKRPETAHAGRFDRPNYMTVGSDGPSESATKLQALLDNDSGYGGSISDGMEEHLVDRPIPKGNEGHRTVASHIHQLHYNHNRTALGRAITRTLDALRKLQEYNQQWPAHYPSSQPTPRSPTSPIDVRPGLNHTQSHDVRKSLAPPSPLTKLQRPSPLRRAETSAGDGTENAESSKQAEQKPAAEPRLVTPQLARDFSVLKLDLKMDNLPQTEIIHSMRKDSRALAQLLDGQISKSVRHLSLLRERIEDTSSKVLVTGDLNAGKSTFCNALLRRKILPEDDQPCTSIFCEVLDVGLNAGIEEVHAIPLGSTYNRNDESSYDVFPLNELEKIVGDGEHYNQCKIYVKDIRTVDESLLNNGVLDIALIDAPGLNADSIKTTAIFARQEEIDVIVFVVHAMNHFTQSAKEFIYDAAREKEFMFMVVNNFNTVKNQERCQEKILEQVMHLSPATFKESADLVHFVSSNAVPVAPRGGPDGLGGSLSGSSSGGSGSGGDPGDDGDDGPDKGKGKQREQIQDFEELEASLRRFVLEKRARTKLAPARTYLLNVLDDMSNLATVNRDVAQSELERVAKELHDLEPVLDKSKHARNDASESLDQISEDTAAGVYSHTRDTLTTTIADVSQRDLGLVYPGVLDSYRFAEDVVAAMLEEVQHTVGSCENHARQKTGEGVNAIRSLGLLHLGDSYVDLHFQSDKMLRRRKDALARQVDIEIEAWDFFDLASLWDQQEKVAGTGMAVTVAGVLGGRLVGGMGWVDGAVGMARILGSRGWSRLVVPCLIGSVIFGISYVVASIPQSLPRRLSHKLAAQLSAIDFVHANSLRISSEARRALKIPADNLRVGLQRNLEQLQTKREATNKVRMESEVARKYFGNLVRESHDVRTAVQRVDLEGPGMGPAMDGVAM